MNSIELSILNTNVNKAKELEQQLGYYIDTLHIDIMDGNFVKNISNITPEYLEELNSNNQLHLHFMVDDVYEYFQDYKHIPNIAKVSFHFESKFFQTTIKDVNYSKFYDLYYLLKSKNIQIGLAINPETSIDDIKGYIMFFKFIMVMSVNPGQGGQKFIEDSKKKLLRLFNNYAKKVYVDGGVNDNILADIQKQIHVAIIGSYLTNEPNNITKISPYIIKN